jgi:hypothetical protein
MIFRDRAEISDLDGSLAWVKAPIKKATATTLYPGGFSLQIHAKGARYTAPAAGVRAITLPDKANNATITITGGNLGVAVPPFAITLPATNTVTMPNFTMHIAAKTGLLTGGFTPPGAPKPVPFAGAVFQKLDADGFGDAAGSFTGHGQVGSIDLAPIP